MFVLYKQKYSYVSDNTKKERYPLSLNVLYSMCLITTKQRQQLSPALQYVQHQKEMMCQTEPQKKDINF